MRAVPLQARALDPLDRIKAGSGSPLLFPGERGGYLDLHHFRPFHWRPPRRLRGSRRFGGSTISGTRSRPSRSVPAISTFDLSRYMGASLTMIDRDYGHLARDGPEHAIKLLDGLSARWTLVDAA